MNNVVIERDTFSTDVMAAIMLIVSVVLFYLLGNVLPIIIVFISIICFWLGRSLPVEYFWANDEGIEFHTGKEVVHQVLWCSVDSIFVDSYGTNNSNSGSLWAVKIKLKVKLEKNPYYIGASGFFITTLLLKEGKNNHKIFKQLKKLKEQNAIRETH